MANVNEFINRVRDFNGFASLTFIKKNLVKKSCPIADVTERVQYSHVQIGTSYENAVNNRCERINGTREFVSEPLRYGEWYIVNKVYTHKGEYYLRYYTNKNTRTTRTLFVGNRPATASEIEIIKAHRYAVSHSISRRQAEQGIPAAEQVEVRGTKIAGIIQFKFGDYSF